MFNKRVIKVISITIILTMALMLSNIINAKDKSFINKGSSWAKEALENANKNELLEGIPGEINPKKDLTRAEMASIMNNIFNSHVESDISKYTDMKKDAWYYSDMAKAVHMDMFTGYNNKLNPENAITREEAFVVISRAFKVKELHKGEEPKNFKDLNKISSWAKEDIYCLVESGYLKGSNGNINPSGNITMEEFLQIIDNIIGQIISKPGLYDKIDKGNIVVNKPAIIIRNQTVGGDLIIAEGVAEEDIILDNVVVRGNVIVRGGELVLKQDTLVNNIYVDKVDDNFKLITNEDTLVKYMTLNSISEITGEGKVAKIKVLPRASRSRVFVPSTYIENDDISTTVFDAAGYRVKPGTVLINDIK